ncbi:MAG: hypothetical protein A07HR60_02896 [uncultured archaeon A07HR60]|nr:MAG: hypothetical protein A07HR60_02896 [uncultured archaeon A07HR60]
MILAQTFSHDRSFNSGECGIAETPNQKLTDTTRSVGGHRGSSNAGMDGFKARILRYTSAKKRSDGDWARAEIIQPLNASFSRRCLVVFSMSHSLSLAYARPNPR